MFRNIAYPAFLIFAGLCFITGITFTFGIAITICLTIGLLKYSKLENKVIITVFLLFSFSYFSNYLYFKRLSKNINNPITFTGIILSSVEKDHYTTGKLLSISLNKYNGKFLSFARIYDYTIPGKTKYLKGMFIKGTGLIKEKTIFKNKYTNKTNFYKSRNSIYYISLPSIKNQKISKNIIFKLFNLIDNIQLDENQVNSSVLKAIVSGDKSEIPYNLKTKLQNSGIYHLFVVSGFHFGIFFSMIYFVLSLIPIRKKMKHIISLLILIILLFINSFSPSTVRAFSMLFIYFLFNTFDIEIKPIDAVGVAGLIMVTINFYHPFDPGFLLSFLVTGGIINSINKKDNLFKTLVKIPFVAFFISFPIILAFFNKINLISPILNILATPLVSCIIYSYFISIFKFPLFIEITNLLTGFLIYLSEIGAGFSTSLFINFYLGYLLVILSSILSLMTFSIKKTLIFILIVGAIIFTNSNLTYNTNYLLVPDTGQSQAIFIQSENETILIDTGTKYSSIAALIPILQNKKIKKIHHLFLSHFDSDHGGGLINILNSFEIENIYFPYYDKNSKNFLKCYSKIKEKSIKLLKVKKGQVYQFNKKVHIKIINPVESIMSKSSNSSSMALIVKCYGKTITIPGDLDGSDLMKSSNLFEKTDILIAPHHGSKKAAIESFANITNPESLIICAGKNNRFNFPSKEFLSLYSSSNIWITGKQGEFLLKF